MTKKIKILIITVILSVAAIIFFAFYGANITLQNKEKENSLLLKSKENHIALYEGEKIIEIYDQIDIGLLTDYDRFLLRNGIEVKSKEDVLTILEDYDG